LNVVDHHGRRTQHVGRHARQAVDHPCHDPDRAPTDRSGAAGVTPIETYIDETVAVLADLLEDTPAEMLAGFDFKLQGVWAFARPGAPPLKASESLDGPTVRGTQQ
jgi:hypothetical protein